MDKETIAPGNDILLDTENRTIYFAQNGVEVTQKHFDKPITVADYVSFKNSILNHINLFSYGCVGIGTGKATVHVR